MSRRPRAWNVLAGSLLAAVIAAGCGLLPAPEQPASRVPVGPWVAFAREEPRSSPEIASFLRARGVALRALADHRTLLLTEPTDAILIPALLRVDDAGGAVVYRVSSVAQPPEAWVLTFRAPATEGGLPTEALVVVDAASLEVLLVHAESRGAAPSHAPTRSGRGSGRSRRDPSRPGSGPG